MTDREERGWNLAPPVRCLKNDRQPLADVFVLADPVIGAQPQLEHAARIGEKVIVGNLESGSVASLDGAEEDMWEALVSKGSEEVVIEEISTLHKIRERSETTSRRSSPTCGSTASLSDAASQDAMTHRDLPTPCRRMGLSSH